MPTGDSHDAGHGDPSADARRENKEDLRKAVVPMKAKIWMAQPTRELAQPWKQYYAPPAPREHTMTDTVQLWKNEEKYDSLHDQVGTVNSNPLNI